MDNPLVIYHSNCFDGFGAAWVAWHALGEVCFLPAKYGDAPPDVTGKDVYILDFSYPRATLQALAADAHSLLVLDHHKTALANCEGLAFCVFDMNRSGAGIAWDHFGTPKDAAAKRPPLVNYIEDRDLWRFALPYSREVHAWLESWPKDFNEWNRLASILKHDFESVVTEGRAILRAMNQKVEDMCREAHMVDLGDGPVPAVNVPYNFGSVVGERLGQLFPSNLYAAYYFDRADGEQQWGLRSTGYDVSEVAKRFGGGGHRQASGFVKGKVTR